MTNPYPAEFSDQADTVVRLGGEITFTDPANQPGGGSTPVACVLACDTTFDIHALGNYDVLWDALYDNLWDVDPLAAIPAGLGLAFVFDGSSSLVVPTEAGFWSFSYFGTRDADSNWAGSFAVGGVGLNFPWVQAKIGDGGVVATSGTPYMAATMTTALPSGTQLTHQVATVNAAASNPSNVTQVYLSIVRHA